MSGPQLRFLLCMILIAILSAGCELAPVQAAVTVAPTSIPIPNSPASPLHPEATALAPAAEITGIPFDLISEESLFAYLEDLTSIQPYSGWRNSASRGEAEALDYVAGKLRSFSSLRSLGLELERQSFNVYLSTEIWDSRLFLTVGGQEIEVPADGLRGSRNYRSSAVYFDSDGSFGDSQPDPVTVDGAPILVLDDDLLYKLAPNELEGRILFLDYALIDTIVNGDAASNLGQLINLLNRGPAGLVLLTQYSNRPGESRGSLIGDGSDFNSDVPSRRVPILYARLEDLSPAGIAAWEDLRKINKARLVLDADVLSPGEAGNLIARIPGADPSTAVILGAHIDSPNGPGAFDDGSGAAALLEIARVFDVSRIQPPVDVYLAWFGGHEIGTYGSAHFAATHQELLDRTLGLVQMDGLGYPLEGRPSKITLMFNAYDRFGDDRLPMPDFLVKAAAPHGLALDRLLEHGLIADNTNFDAFNVPNVYLGYMNAGEYLSKGSGYFHFANHWHDPYESVDLARQAGEAYTGMVKVMLSAALELGRLQPDLRVTPPAAHRALFLASHTETTPVVTSMLRELGMALAWAGFDVDLIPYNQPIPSAGLENAGIVVLPPALDYSGKSTGQWSEAELAQLEAYVAGGGFLVVTNSSCNYLTKRCLDGTNEDKLSINPLLEPMGIKFTFGGGLSGDVALAVAAHPLTENAPYLTFYSDQGVPFRMKSGLELVRTAGRPLAALLDYGYQGGQVLVIADLGLLQADSSGAKNIEFLKNIARYASER